MSLRSKPFDTYPGAPLSDSKIRAYILAGKYGPILQAAEAARSKGQRAKVSQLPPKPKPLSSSKSKSNLDTVMDELMDL